MKKTLTKSLSVLTAILMLVSIVPIHASTVDDSAVRSGNHGDAMHVNLASTHVSDASEYVHNENAEPVKAFETNNQLITNVERELSGIKYVPRKIQTSTDNIEIWDGSVAEGYAGGTGTEDEPYLISNGAELAYLAQQANTSTTQDACNGIYYKLTADIYLNDTTGWENWAANAPANEWTAIGNTEHVFCGCFDGNGYAVFGMYINKPIGTDDPEHDALGDYQGLFGAAAGLIMNLSVEKSYAHARMFCGLILGYGFQSNLTVRIANCYNTGNAVFYAHSSGIAGRIDGCAILDSYNTGNIEGVKSTAGICGSSEIGLVYNCNNAGNILGRCLDPEIPEDDLNYDPNHDIGGVVGFNYSATIVKCSNTGNVTGLVGNKCCGGITADGVNGGIIFDCENSGIVSGQSNVGGIVGSALTTFISGSHNTGSIMGNDKVGGIAGFAAKIMDCSNEGKVSGSTSIGGVAGQLFGGIMNNAYNSGEISGNDNVGGIVGSNGAESSDKDSTGIVCCSYNVGEVSSENGAGMGAVYGACPNGIVLHSYYLDGCCAGGNEAGVKLTEVQMKDPASYEAFDFHNVWAVEPESGYEYPMFIKYLDKSYGGDSKLWSGDIASGFESGTGTEDDPYIIVNAEQLAFLAQDVNSGNKYKNKFIKLDADITLNDYNTKYWTLNAAQWIPIGTKHGVANYCFAGNFDGAGHTVSGIYINDPTAICLGLFGNSSGLIQNVNVDNSYIVGYAVIAGIAGGNNKGKIKNCSSEACLRGVSEVGGISGNSLNGSIILDCENSGYADSCYYAGGIIGSSEECIIQNCMNSGHVTGCRYVGGVFGSEVNANALSNCTNDGSVEGGIAVGGAAGYAFGAFGKCRNSGDVTGYYRVGGIAGYATDITESYNTGRITGSYTVGGVAGYTKNRITDCYNCAAVTGVEEIGGLVGTTQNACVIATGYNVGNVSGEYSAYAVVGSNGGEVKNCYYLDNCCEEGDFNASPLTDEQLREQDSYKKFDFEDIWTMEGDPDYLYAELQTDISHPTKCHVKFRDEVTMQFIGEELEVKYGYVLTDNDFPLVPEHEGYTFDKWDYNGEPVTEDIIVTALFKPFTYTVTWLNWDGTELEKDENVPYNTAPAYDGEEPTKPAEAFTYKFIGWKDEEGNEYTTVSHSIMPLVTEDVKYTAVFAEDQPVNGRGFYFETDPAEEGWSWRDDDGDGHTWEWVHDHYAYIAPEGTGFMISWSRILQGGGDPDHTHDNWLISPVVKGGGEVSFIVTAYSPADLFLGDEIGVYVLTENGSVQSEELGHFKTEAEAKTYTVDLSAFNGQDIQIAFRHYVSKEIWYVGIDKVIVTWPQSVKGDYDCDGDVDMEDAILTLRAAMELITPSAQSLLNADVDFDNNLTVRDAVLILRAAMKLIEFNTSAF